LRWSFYKEGRLVAVVAYEGGRMKVPPPLRDRMLDRHPLKGVCEFGMTDGPVEAEFIARLLEVDGNIQVVREGVPDDLIPKWDPEPGQKF